MAFISSRMNAGRSSGLRLVMTFPSTTTGSSTNLAPALVMSSLIEWNPVARRPRKPVVEQSTHGPWAWGLLRLAPCSPLGEGFHHCDSERGKVVGLPAGDHVPVDHHFLV